MKGGKSKFFRRETIALSWFSRYFTIGFLRLGLYIITGLCHNSPSGRARTGKRVQTMKFVLKQYDTALLSRDLRSEGGGRLCLYESRGHDRLLLYPRPWCGEGRRLPRSRLHALSPLRRTLSKARTLAGEVRATDCDGGKDQSLWIVLKIRCNFQIYRSKYRIWLNLP